MEGSMLAAAALQLVLLGLTVAAAVAARSAARGPIPAAPPPPEPVGADPVLVARLDALGDRLDALERAAAVPAPEVVDVSGPRIAALGAAVAALGERVAAAEARAAALEDRFRLPLLESPKSAEPATAPAAVEPSTPHPTQGRPRRSTELPISVFDFDPEILLTPPDRGRARAIRTDPPPPGEDKLAGARRDPSRNFLTRPAFGAPDDLTRIRGVDADTATALAGLGVFYLWQVAAWHVQDVAEVARALHLPVARISSEGWVRQARAIVDGGLAAAPPN